MMKNFSPKMRFICVLLIVIFPAACALPPKHIRAKKVSPKKYQDYTCEQIKQELFVVDYKLFQLTWHQKAQVNERNEFLHSPVFPLLIFSIPEGNKNEEIAQLKGEYEALEYVAKQKGCSLDEEAEEINTDQTVNEDD